MQLGCSTDLESFYPAPQAIGSETTSFTSYRGRKMSKNALFRIFSYFGGPQTPNRAEIEVHDPGTHRSRRRGLPDAVELSSLAVVLTE